MNKLYNSSGYIRTNTVGKALRNAKFEGKLHNVPSSKIKYFEKSLAENMKESKGKIGSNVNQREMQYLMKKMIREKHDNVLNKELKEIEKVVLDKKFDAD